MLESFEEWFAIRNRNSDEDIWPGKLKFSEDAGITLEAVCHRAGRADSNAPCCDAGTITGYLDYQRPTTIIDPWVQSQGGGSSGLDTPVMRAKSRILASAVLKNIHMESSNEKCFTAMHMDMPSFSTWYAPQLVKTSNEHIKDSARALSVEIGGPTREEFLLKSKTNVIVQSFAAANEKGDETTITQRTFLTFEFPDAIDYSAVQNLIARVNSIFSFLLGHRMAHNPYRIKTTHTRKWNNQDEHITAELFFQPAFKSTTHHVNWNDAIFRRQDCALTPEDLLNAASDQPDAIFYLMNMVLLLENPEKLSASSFGELVGCIEDFDNMINRSGSSADVRSARRALRKIVKEYGRNDDLRALDELMRTQPNRVSLAERLDRLQASWSKSGFRGRIKASEITKIRNDVAHGRAVNLSPEDYQRIIWLQYDLCAISRFHIFRALGIQEQEIAAAFRRLGLRYGRYAPER
ncbi:hypothetical protein ACFO5X_13900 [Seohaeicola nanhaiensis]|uniref:ApeA N-terminal domain-containing protein n=1 Tax=Seohaeicola nanhaiensis TaxID=1387282 RepID=A0ABV9KHR9_9RHOB